MTDTDLLEIMLAERYLTGGAITPDDEIYEPGYRAAVRRGIRRASEALAQSLEEL